MQKFSKEAVDQLLKEYKCARDAAEGVELANGLREAFRACVDAGEMTEEEYLFACSQGLDEIRERAGTDAKHHERKARRTKEQIVLSNMGLVRKVAGTVLGSAIQNPDNLEEAMQEGSMGVAHAVEVYDESRGQWSACARNWIWHALNECHKKQIYFPPQRSQKMPPEVIEQVRRFRTQRGRDPEPHEVWAFPSKLSKSARNDIRKLRGRGAPPESIAETLGLARKPVTSKQWRDWTERASVFSFERANTYGDEDNQNSTGNTEFIADERSNPDLLIANANLSEKLQVTLSEMSPRHADIARAIFVDGDSNPEVIEKFGISERRLLEIKRMLADRLRKVLHA